MLRTGCNSVWPSITAGTSSYGNFRQPPQFWYGEGGIAQFLFASTQPVSREDTKHGQRECVRSTEYGTLPLLVTTERVCTTHGRPRLPFSEFRYLPILGQHAHTHTHIHTHTRAHEYSGERERERVIDQCPARNVIRTGAWPMTIKNLISGNYRLNYVVHVQCSIRTCSVPVQ